jgi:hypothetical protein
MNTLSLKKVIKVEFSLQGSTIKKMVSAIEELILNDEVFNENPKTGSIEHNRECILGSPAQHPLKQPARGLINDIRGLIGGSDQTGHSARSLDVLLKEAAAYAEATNKVFHAAVDEVQNTLSHVTPLALGKVHRRQAFRKHHHVHVGSQRHYGRP